MYVIDSHETLSQYSYIKSLQKCIDNAMPGIVPSMLIGTLMHY